MQMFTAAVVVPRTNIINTGIYSANNDCDDLIALLLLPVFGNTPHLKNARRNGSAVGDTGTVSVAQVEVIIGAMVPATAAEPTHSNVELYTQEVSTNIITLPAKLF